MNVQYLVTGGPGGHDAAAIGIELRRVAARVGLATTILDGPDGVRRAAEAAEPGDVVTIHALHLRATAPEAAHLAGPDPGPDPDDIDVVDEWVRSGGGLVALHTAVICFDGDPRWRALCGAVWNWGTSWHPPLGAVPVHREAHVHPITVGVDDFCVEDEAYAELDFDLGVVPLATTAFRGSTLPLVWARDVGDGRVVTDLLGHDAASIAVPEHLRLLGQALRWAARGADGE